VKREGMEGVVGLRRAEDVRRRWQSFIRDEESQWVGEQWRACPCE
jgi:hypothetical protein